MKRLLLIPLVALLAGCDNMQHQANRRPLTPSAFFENGASARHPPAHTVAADGEIPGVAAPLDALGRLQRGRDLFEADCAPCHGADGYGTGIVVRRGFPKPESLHAAGQRTLTDGQLFSAITSGKGTMYPFSDRLVPDDRWLIVSYIRALQRSQHATIDDVPQDDRKELVGP